MTFSPSYFPNYFSIVDIMVTQETVPCTIQTNLSRLGFLIPGNDGEDVSKNTSMELPFWLASYLIEKRNMVKINIPKVYDERSREIFEADAKVVNLHRINPYFYEFGRYLSCLNQREADLVKSLIIKGFKERFRVILDWADSAVEVRKMQMLDVSERGLLKEAHQAGLLLNEWLVEGVSSMQPAQMVSNLRKRKLIDDC